MNNNRIAIIIVTFNSEKYISNCINAIQNNFSKKNLYEIIIIDNNSSDETVKIIKRIQAEHPSVKLIQNNKNLGFAKAVNLGIRLKKQSDYYLLINPDTIINGSSIINLIRCAIKSDSGIVGGTTYDSNKAQSGSFFRFPNLWVGLFDFTNLRKFDRTDYWHKYFYYLDRDSSNRACFPVDVVTGGFMLITKKTIKKNGYFDEKFFMYLEDVDFCLRAKKIGIKVSHCNDAKTFHFGGGSSNNKDRIRHSAWLFSRKLYYLKNFNLLTNILIQPVFLLDDVYILLNKLFMK
ncbi:MAG: Glycosyl transferase family 2 [Candidatus Collierbacteria bacterium GW2011_GWB1_44_6]|uniref:Glycosyl transferase family 2 n=2 Tax=Candidatus Collieribacteriota TaxID=1752725 RepID=A0A0G1MP80_9BACT|nr:MAG: Glycosyl transferase family 2 [Candidatus Collierbacteria bacterium GW2011_GWC2_43_12]KKT73834.1 MAG: Glycosyl transferase family 2 [Candidatus Collierbacteria bacterium GW2011_GWB1_44_6]KKT84122.1 MAG: Glycosyl transferase family 2 [Microgenomates group bacterium GW2011_GWC1_44_9]